MANITLEQLKKEFKDQDTRIEKKFDGLDKKIDGAEKRLGQKIETEVGNLAAMTERRAQEILKQLDVRDRVSNLERDMQKIKVALHI